MIIAVRYDYDPTRDLAPTRPAHRQFLRDLLEAGAVITSGPLPASNGALLVMEADSPEAALQLLESDPFLTGGFILRRTAEQWVPVLGVLAPE